MNFKTKRARQGGSPSLAPAPHQISINQELISMLPNNQLISKKRNATQSSTTPSPWYTHQDFCIFGYELSIANDTTVHSFLKPHPFFMWLLKHKAEKLFWDSLAKCCPMLPFYGHKNAINTFLSPPPSGAPTATFIVVGHDLTGNLRAVGCNWINPSQGALKQQASQDFFGIYDQLNTDNQKYNHICSEAFNRMTSTERKLLQEVEYECYKYGTMPIVIVALDDELGPLFAISPALIKTHGSCDFSCDFVGEIL